MRKRGKSLLGVALGQADQFKVKLMAQFSAALVLVAFGIVFRTMSLPVVGTFDLGWWGYPMTILWIVAMTNIFNFMDGLDGLAGGCGVILNAVMPKRSIAVRAAAAASLGVSP